MCVCVFAHTATNNALTETHDSNDLRIQVWNHASRRASKTNLSAVPEEPFALPCGAFMLHLSRVYYPRGCLTFVARSTMPITGFKAESSNIGYMNPLGTYAQLASDRNGQRRNGKRPTKQACSVPRGVEELYMQSPISQRFFGSKGKKLNPSLDSSVLPARDAWLVAGPMTRRLVRLTGVMISTNSQNHHVCRFLLEGSI